MPAKMDDSVNFGSHLRSLLCALPPLIQDIFFDDSLIFHFLSEGMNGRSACTHTYTCPTFTPHTHTRTIRHNKDADSSRYRKGLSDTWLCAFRWLCMPDQASARASNIWRRRCRVDEVSMDPVEDDGWREGYESEKRRQVRRYMLSIGESRMEREE
jgi:hypothetical protein